MAPTDGNFAHADALYDMLSTLRERYPNLLIENVSGGGNRLDLGMLRYTDVGVDGRPHGAVGPRPPQPRRAERGVPARLSAVVRHRPRHRAAARRARSVAVLPQPDGRRLGLCFRTADAVHRSRRAGMAHEIAIYKSLRDTLSVSAGSLLTQQAATRRRAGVGRPAGEHGRARSAGR